MPDPATQRIQALVAGLTNYERTRPNAIRWSLETIRTLLARPGALHPGGQLVQVGGSKGKGGTTRYLEQLAGSAGLRTGSYLSPHVVSVLERVRLLGSDIEIEELVRALEPILTFVRASALPATFFEVMTAAAVQLFAEHEVELAVLEVGIGGRLDATTAVPVDATVLTNVELEHVALLGPTVERIALEKAHIARSGKPMLTAVEGPALEVVREHCRAVGAPLLRLGADFGIEDLADEGTRFSGVLRDAAGRRERFTLADAPRVELRSLALAFAALRVLRPGIATALDPVPRPLLPGRFEVEAALGGTFVLDGAHTEDSSRALAEELARRFPGRRFAVLFASAADKRWQEGLSRLLPLAESVLVTRLADTACVEPDEIVAWCVRQGRECASVPDLESALAELVARGRMRLVTGSFYLVGAVRSRIVTPAHEQP